MRALVSLLVILAAARGAHAYELKKTAAGTPLRWPEGRLHVAIAATGAPEDVPAEDAVAAAGRAFATWGAALAALPLDLSIDAEPTVEPTRAERGRSAVTWVSAGWDDEHDPEALAITMTSYEPESGRIVDADIAVNAERFRWSAGDDGCRGAFDVENVLAHEAGHLLGLGHDEDPAATMFATAGSCETSKRDLHSSDLAGVAYLYGELGPAAPAGTTGCAIASPGGEPASGLLGAALVAAATILGRRSRRRRRGRPGGGVRAVVVVAAVLGLAATAQATTARGMSLPELGARADAAVRGRVVTQRAVRVGDRVYTDTVVEVDEAWKGAAPPTLTVRQLGGEADGLGLVVEGIAPLAVGDETVLFLRPRTDATWAPVGMAQGAFRVVRRAGRVRLRRDARGLMLVDAAGTRVGALEELDLEVVRAAAGGPDRRTTP